MTEMSYERHEWRSVVADPQFRAIAVERRATVVTLAAAAATYYFAIPAAIEWAPALLKYRFGGGLNCGIVFAVSQYPVGGLLALVFMRQMAKLDRKRARLVGALAKAAGDRVEAAHAS
jgi:uncharacterized membrane protein (DUF485 family)